MPWLVHWSGTLVEMCIRDSLLIEDWRHFDVVWCTRPAAISHLIQWGFHWCDSRPRIVYEIAAGYANRDLRDESASSLWDAVDPLLADACDIVLVLSLIHI